MAWLASMLEVAALAAHLGVAATVTAWLWPRDVAAPALRACVAFALGLGLAAVSAFWEMHWLDGWSALWRLGEVVVGGALILVLRVRVHGAQNRGPAAEPVVARSSPALAWLVVFLALLFVVQLALRACASPTGSYDATANWNLRARAFWLASERWREFMADQPGIPHPDYPALLPLTVTRLWRLCAQSYAVVPILLGVGYAIATVVAVGAGVAIKHGSRLGLLAAALLLATPDLGRQAVAQIADVPVGLAYTLAGLLAWLALDAGDRAVATWALCGALLGVALWTKNEATLFAVLFGASVVGVVACTQGWRAGLRAGIAVALAAAPFACTLHAFKACAPTANELLPWGRLEVVVSSLLDLSRWRIASSEIGSRVIGYGNSLFLILVVAVVWARRSAANARPPIKPAVFLLCVVLASMLLGHLGVALASPYPLAFHIQSTESRLLLQLWPLTVSVLCALMPDTLMPDSPMPDSRGGRRIPDR